MRIIYWLEQAWPPVGGVEMEAARIIPRLRSLGHDMVVFTSTISGAEDRYSEYEGIPTYRFPFGGALRDGNPSLLFRSLEEVGHEKRRFRPDLVHLAKLGPDAFFHLRTAAAFQAPYILSITQYVPPDFAKHDSLFREALASASAVTAVSQSVLAQLHAVAPETIHKSTVIHNSIPQPPAEPGPLHLSRPRLLCLGRFTPEKGFRFAVDAFAEVHERVPEATLTMAGDGPERAALEMRVQKYGLHGAVRFSGWVPPDKVWDVMNRAGLVIVPSLQEGFGLVAGEASAMGRPVVATRVGGLPEVILHERTGLLVPRGDAQAMAAAILSLVHDPAGAGAMGRAGRHHVRTSFDVDRCGVPAYDALYHNVRKGGANDDNGADSAQG